MRLLFCSPNPVKQELGASRVLLGMAKGMSQLGWECRLIGPENLTKEASKKVPSGLAYANALKSFLLQEASKFDVVDYDHLYLPFARDLFTDRTLFVARSVLLMHHFCIFPPPELLRLTQRIKRRLTGTAARERKATFERRSLAQCTLVNADLVNVANEDDRRVLVEAGIDATKIVVIPYGLSIYELATLAKSNADGSNRPERICFLGTFDGRKGGVDMPELCANILRNRPACCFRLLGTAGVCQSSEQVLAFFPPAVRARIEVVARFDRAELPHLLDGCAVGIFPSYIEGFGFGVLEMLAAGLPVVAYRRPGPPMMLEDDMLVSAGDVTAMAARVVSLLSHREEYEWRATWARNRAKNFSWESACRLTDSHYRRRLESLRTAIHPRADKGLSLESSELS